MTCPFIDHSLQRTSLGKLSLRIVSVQLLGGKIEGPSAPSASYQSAGMAPAPQAGPTAAPNEITEPLDDLPF